jgi:hypothetical protein
VAEAATAADDALAAAEALHAASESESAGAGPLGAIGLLFSDASDDLAEAESDFEQGDYAGTQSAAADVEDTMDGAAMAGVLRLLGVLFVGLLVAGVWILLRAGRARRRAAVPDEPLEPDGAEGVGSSTDGSREVGM